jgi:hypothetical protein
MVPDVSLDLDMTSTLYQIVGDEFFYLTYLFRSWQNTICQVKFGKLLEMLSTSKISNLYGDLVYTMLAF